MRALRDQRTFYLNQRRCARFLLPITDCPLKPLFRGAELVVLLLQYVTAAAHVHRADNSEMLQCLA
jgi:hypothetical protein